TKPGERGCEPPLAWRSGELLNPAFNALRRHVRRLVEEPAPPPPSVAHPAILAGVQQFLHPHVRVAPPAGVRPERVAEPTRGPEHEGRPGESERKPGLHRPPPP